MRIENGKVSIIGVDPGATALGIAVVGIEAKNRSLSIETLATFETKTDPKKEKIPNNIARIKQGWEFMRPMFRPSVVGLVVEAHSGSSGKSARAGMHMLIMSYITTATLAWEQDIPVIPFHEHKWKKILWGYHTVPMAERESLVKTQFSNAFSLPGYSEHTVDALCLCLALLKTQEMEMTMRGIRSLVE